MSVFINGRIIVATNGSTYSAKNDDEAFSFQPAGTIAGCTINPPPFPRHRQLFSVYTTAQITSVTWTAASGSQQTIVGAPTELLANSGITFYFDGPTRSWNPIR